MTPTPHLDKLSAAQANLKCSPADRDLLIEAVARYNEWIRATSALTSVGEQRVRDMVALLNSYKDHLEVTLIAKRGSAFIKRQKGQLKLDNSVLEEFLPRLIIPEVLSGLNHTRFTAGPQQAFMSLSFMPSSFDRLGRKPEVVIKTKDQDFVIGSPVYYRMAPTPDFRVEETADGSLFLAVLAAETKVNLDKTMFQEAAGTATRLKQGCPVARYYLLVEYLDMTPEDTRLTHIDNVYLLRRTKRLPFEKRNDPATQEEQHRAYPISSEVVWRFVQQVQQFVDVVWYDPNEALRRGSFV